MTESGKRLLIHLAWGLACLVLAYLAIEMRLHIADEDLRRARQPDFQQWQSMRTLEDQLRDRRDAHSRAVAVL